MNKGSELLMNVKIFSVILSNVSVNTLTVPDVLPRANSRERRKSKQPLTIIGQWLLRYSRWESNPNLRFRKPPFYPLNYRSIKTSAGIAADAISNYFLVARAASFLSLRRAIQ